MMKPWLKWTLVALPLLVGGFIVYKKLRKPQTKPTPPTPPTPTPPEIKPKPPVRATDSFPLKRGSKGAKVKELQKYILQKDSKALPKFGADGGFGKETEDALYRLFFGYITIDKGVISVANQQQLDAIKEQAKPIFQSGAPLVYQYQQPTQPFLF